MRSVTEPQTKAWTKEKCQELIVTFLIVFLIQNTQNRDAKATQLKLDELIHAVKGARNSLINLENFGDKELDDLQRQFERLRSKKG